MSLLFKNCSLVEVISILLIRFNKTTSFLLGRTCNEGNGVNEQNKQMHHTPVFWEYFENSVSLTTLLPLLPLPL